MLEMIRLNVSGTTGIFLSFFVVCLQSSKSDKKKYTVPMAMVKPMAMCKS